MLFGRLLKDACLLVVVESVDAYSVLNLFVLVEVLLLTDRLAIAVVGLRQGCGIGWPQQDRVED